MAELLMSISILVPIAILIGSLILLARLKSAKLTFKAKKWWLITHILFVMIYFSGILGALLLNLLVINIITEQEAIYNAHVMAKYFDWFLVIPGAFGSLLTGIWLALRTNWGLIQYHWILVKTVSTIGAMLYGSSLMRIWFDQTIHLSSNSMINPMTSPLYLYNHQMMLLGCWISLAILMFLLIVSYLKPWGMRKNQKKLSPG